MSDAQLNQIITAGIQLVITLCSIFAGASITYILNIDKYKLDKSWEMRIHARNLIISELNLSILYYTKAFEFIIEDMGGSRKKEIQGALSKAIASEAAAHEKFSESQSILGTKFCKVCKELFVDLQDKSDLEYEGGRIYDVIASCIERSVKLLEAERDKDLPRAFR